MSHWNYRVMRRKEGDDVSYGFYEVYYDENNNAIAWSEEPVPIVVESTEELAQVINQMESALLKPILDYHAGQIDWKHLATTFGYQSLKAAYIKDVRRKERSKEQLLRKFNWVISRAKHYAHKKEVSVEQILNEWERGRDYWWLNYYQDCHQPKLHSHALQPKKYKTRLESQKKPAPWCTQYKNFKRSVS